MLKPLWQRFSGGGFGANTALTAGTNLVMAALGMASGILAARILGPGGRGELAAIQTWPSFVATLAMLGMGDALVYFSAREPDQAGRLLGAAVAIALLSSAFFMSAAYAAMPAMLRAQSPGVVRAGRWYLFVIPIYALVAIPHTALRGRNDFAPWNLMRLAPTALWIGVLALAWECGRAAPTFLAAANLAAMSLLFFPFAALVARRVPGPFLPDPRRWSAMIRYGLPCMMTALPQTLNFRLDQMLMAALLPARQLGLYVVAVAWSGAISPLLSAVGAATMPSVASAGDEGQGVRRFAEAVRTASALAMVLCVVLTAATPAAIQALFGAGFGEAMPAAVVLMPAGAISGLNYVLQEGLRGMGRPYAALRAEFAGLAITAIALAATLRPMGIMGAAIASLLGYSTVTVVLLANAKRYAGTPPTTLLLPRSGDVQRILARLAALARGSGGPAEALPHAGAEIPARAALTDNALADATLVENGSVVNGGSRSR